MHCKSSWSLLVPVFIQTLLLNSCGGNVRAPVEAPGEQAKQAAPVPHKPRAAEPVSGPSSLPGQAPAFYIVNRGDTLYSIAWNYGFDYREVAAWNAIKPPYVIYPGQRIQLAGKSAVANTQHADSVITADTALIPGPIVIKRSPGIDEKVKKEPAPVPTPALEMQKAPSLAGDLTWTWPTQGRVVKADTPIAKNGIDIAGTQGQQINASAPGEVVYSGSGLLGYGRLIIIKHNDTFLSAYAHNSELLVKEGDRVSGGQEIALMGESTNGKALLHFEIRKNGTPVDPLKYLP